MPGRDGTGPSGQGPGTGRGHGRGSGGRSKSSGQSAGLVEICICPACGKKKEHTRGNPCNEMKCPECGINMVRA